MSRYKTWVTFFSDQIYLHIINSGFLSEQSVAFPKMNHVWYWGPRFPELSTHGIDGVAGFASAAGVWHGRGCGPGVSRCGSGWSCISSPDVWDSILWEWAVGMAGACSGLPVDKAQLMHQDPGSSTAPLGGCVWPKTPCCIFMCSLRKASSQSKPRKQRKNNACLSRR